MVPTVELPLDDRHLEDHAGDRADRQERRIALLALLAEARQHDRHHLVVDLEHAEQHRVEAAGLVVVGGAGELVGEAEAIEEGAQPRIVGRAEARIFVRERVGDAGQRLAEIGPHHLLVGDVVGNLAEPVHVVGEAEEPGRDLVLGEDTEGGPDHGRAGDLAEGADMRQAGRAVAGLEEDTAGRRLAPAPCGRRSFAPPRTATPSSAGRPRRGPASGQVVAVRRRARSIPRRL